MREFSAKKALLGKEIEIALKGIDGFMAEELIDDVYDYGLSLQRIFNFFDSKSELNRLNAKRELDASKDLISVIKKALKLCELTRGQYDITLGKQIIQRKKGLPIRPVNCSYKDIKITGNRIILTHEDAIIDLGSIAKGYIVDKMVEHLISRGVLSGLIDARGDIRVFGKESESVDIQHARDKEKIIRTIELQESSVATSGDYNQYHGNYESHIINKKDIISITVVAPSLEEADVYATALFVINKEEREILLKDNKDIGVLTVDPGQDVKFYNNFKSHVKGDK